MPKRERKDLAKLYGMDPVPDDIYDMIMRADSNKATNDEHLILGQYVKEKTEEIRRRKIELGLEGSGYRPGFGKLAEDCFVDLRKMFLISREDEERDEQ